MAAPGFRAVFGTATSRNLESLSQSKDLADPIHSRQDTAFPARCRGSPRVLYSEVFRWKAHSNRLAFTLSVTATVARSRCKRYRGGCVPKPPCMCSGPWPRSPLPCYPGADHGPGGTPRRATPCPIPVPPARSRPRRPRLQTSARGGEKGRAHARTPKVMPAMAPPLSP